MNTNVRELQARIDLRTNALLEHGYFRRCRNGQITRGQLLEIVKQLYCFSVFFERLLARRISEYSSMRDPRVIDLARSHMREEIGHAQMFRECLLANGVSPAEVELLAPRMFTKAMFGYLTVTIQHENEYVANVAIMQVMETIGYHFFTATLAVMQSHGMLADALCQHSEDDEAHSQIGLELASEFDGETMKASERVIDELYRLMEFVLDDWLPATDTRLRSLPQPTLDAPT